MMSLLASSQAAAASVAVVVATSAFLPRAVAVRRDLDDEHEPAVGQLLAFWTWVYPESAPGRSALLEVSHSAISAQKTTVSQANAHSRTEESWFVFVPLIMFIISIALISARRSHEANQTGGQAIKEKKHLISTSRFLGEASLSFEDADLEAKWEDWNAKESIVQGAKALVIMSLFLFCKKLYDATKGTEHIRCQLGEYAPRAWWFEVSSYFASIVLCLYSMHSASRGTYFSVLCFYFILFVVGALPPFRISCEGLQHPEAHCLGVVEQAVKNTDCSLQGMTRQLTLVMWLLFSPWVVPDYRLMHYLWIWIFCVYLGATTIYRSTITKMRFTWMHVVISLFMLSLTLLVATRVKAHQEKQRRSFFLFNLKQRQASEKMFHIFSFMMPVHIITPMLKNPKEPIADQIECVSILFVVITNFEDFTIKYTPEELLDFLNATFSRMDAICEAHGVTKVETVGEEYVACVGVVPADVEENARDGHGGILRRIFAAANDILLWQSDIVRFKMGMHTGPIVAGVIGHKLPRFRLFGDTINTAARMMQKSVPGKLQFGEETHTKIPDSLHAEYRGEVEMKGKGRIKAWLFPPDGQVSARCSGGSARQSVRQPASSTAKRPTIVGEILRPGPTPGSGFLRKFGLMVIATHRKDPVKDGKGAKQKNQLSKAVEARSELDFEHVLGEVQSSESQDQGALSLAVQSFPAEMEEHWKQRFHEENISHNLAKRLDGQAMAVSLLTLCEVIYMVATESWEKEHYLFKGSRRIPVFLTCRAIVFLILAVWWALSSSGWILSNRGAMQVCWVASACLIIVLFYVSYDMLETGQDTFEHSAWIWEGLPTDTKVPFDQSFSIIYLLTFQVLTTYNGFPFILSLVFPLVTAGLVFGHKWHHVGEVMLSEYGRMLFVADAVTVAFIARQAEHTNRLHFQASHYLEVTQQRIDGILNTLMPPLLVKELRERPEAGNPSHNYRLATVAQSDLCGFTNLASTKTPKEVVAFVSQLFGRFDILTDKHEVYKVETVGDAYIAGQAEAPLTEKNDPVSVLLFGVDMITATDEWAADLGVSVTCRVGVHHGECVGGIVGTGMQRYHLFGQFMTIVDTLEATSEEGVTQVSGACKVAIEKSLAETGRTAECTFGRFEQRSIPHLQTSKGEVHDFEEVGGPTFLVRRKVK